MKNTMKEKEGKSGMKRKKYTKIAMTFSLCLMAVWFSLGIGATLAWFTDTTPTDRNSFVIGELDLDVYYKNDLMTDYAEVAGDTPIFNDQALYEPGYTQVVYLKIVNDGNVDFNYKISVDKFSCTESINWYGNRFFLSDHLRFGVMFGPDEETLTRALAREEADQEMINYGMDAPRLNTYSDMDTVTVAAGKTRYAALVVFMPEAVDNVANHQKGAPTPMVQLGATVYAQQAGTQMQ